MQPFKFHSFQEFFDAISPKERFLVDLLRSTILESIPDCKEKLSYNVPYFYKNRNICFIWPASIPWGNVPLDGVSLGFCYGNLLEDAEDYLDKGKRKQVYMKTFFEPTDITIETVMTLLKEAAEIDNLWK